VSTVTHGDRLAITVAATQESIDQRLVEVNAAWHSRRHRPHEPRALADTFVAATSRHLAALDEVLLDEVRRFVPDPDALLAEYIAAARDLEQGLALVKARLYGEAHAIHLDWPTLWERVRLLLTEHNELENALVEALVRHGDGSDLDELVRRVFEAERRAPTRPHPLLPHTGAMGRVARRMWAVADRFWDTAEGRMVPDPVRPVPRRHDSLMAQYLVADPKFDDHASVLEHHRRHHRRRGRERTEAG
jgi:hypothetical protein